MNDIWYKELGFKENPFSIKPNTKEMVGITRVHSAIDKRIKDDKILFIEGAVGTGKTTLLKHIVKKFGQKKVVYYSCNRADKTIDFKKLLLEKRGMLARSLRIKPKDMILLLDEVQFATPRDFTIAYKLYNLNYFSSIVFVAPTVKEVKFPPEIKDEIKGNIFKLGLISPSFAMKLVRGRLGQKRILSPPVVSQIYKKSHNQRSFLENCEDVCRHSVMKGKKKVSAADVKAAL